MGCSICLETYEDDSDKGRRPVALSCGHIFHRSCSDSWLKSCRIRNDPACCPLCKHQLGTARALQLWPGDVNDLDTYLAYRTARIEHQQKPNERRTAPATVMLDKVLDREKQGELLGKLMDFRQHINSYIMAVNNVSMSTLGAKERIFRLFADVSKGDKDKEAEFESSIQALSETTSILNETVSTLEDMRRETEEKNTKAKEESARIEEMKRSLEKHLVTKTNEEQRMNAERSRLHRLEMHCRKELQELERAKEKMERERQAYVKEAREKEHEALKARLESAHMIAQSKGDAQSEVERFKTYALDQEQLRLEAENRASEAKSKSSFLADRNKLLADKLAASRKELKQWKEGSVGGGSTNSRGMQASGGESSIKSESNSTPYIRGKTRQASQDQPLSQSDSQSESQSQSQLEDDGFILTEYISGPPKVKRPRISSEQDDSAIIILDQDFDDDDGNYPMPGFHHQGTSSGTSSTHPTHTYEEDDSVEITGESRRQLVESNPGLIQSILRGHLVLGPRQRPRS